VEKDFEETSARPDTEAELKWWTGSYGEVEGERGKGI